MIKFTLQKILPRLNIILINQIVSLITIPWIAYYFSNIVFGYVAICLIIMQLGWLIINWVNMNYIFEIIKDMKNKNDENFTYTNIIFSQLFLLISYIFIIYLLVLFEKINIPWNLFFSLLPGLIFGGLFPLWFYHIKNQSKQLVKVTLISRILFLAIVFAFIREDSKAIYFLLFQGLSFFVITLYSFNGMFKNYDFTISYFSFQEVFYHLKKSTPFQLNSLSNNYVNTLWGFTLALSASPSIIATFSLADTLYKAGNGFTETISQVLRASTASMNQFKIKPIIGLIFFTYIILLFVGLILIEPAVNILFKEKYLDVAYIMKLMLLVWFLQALIKLFGYPVIGKIRKYTIVNNLGIFFLFMHVCNMFIWYYFSWSLVGLILCFGFVSLLHIFYILIIIFFSRKNYRFF